MYTLLTYPLDIAAHAMRMIFVDRFDPDSRKRCTAEIICRAKGVDIGWTKTLIFPEATTINREVLLQFKKGAFLPGLPVQVEL